MKSLAIVLIHNNDQNRLKSARVTVKFLVDTLSSTNLNVVSFEVSDQPKIKPINRFDYSILRTVEAISQFYYFKIYLKAELKFWVPYLILIFKLPMNFFSSSKKRRISKIEEIITYKHKTAWDFGLEHDFVMVLEDDITKTGNHEQIISLLNKISILDESKLVYADVAGGYPKEKVIPKSLRENHMNLSKFVSNTACGYILNKALDRDLVKFYESRNWLSRLGIDFFLNSFFKQNKKTSFLCFHLDQSGLSHGSFTGRHISWTKHES